ncbi:MAG: winged helix-turn-helix domain-containing protein, partial [Nitrososphaeraceae archaeon]
MPIPDRDTLRSAILNHLSDRKIHNYKETLQYLSEQSRLTDDERKQMIPSGWKRTFDT